MAERRTVIKWVAIGCGTTTVLGVLAFLGCVTLCAGGIRHATAAQGEATGFFADLRADNVEAAYARMDADYQAANNLEAFREAVGRHPILTENNGWSFNSFHVDPGQTTVGGMLRSESGITPASAILHDTGGGIWRISSVTVDDQPL